MWYLLLADDCKFLWKLYILYTGSCTIIIICSLAKSDFMETFELFVRGDFDIDIDLILYTKKKKLNKKHIR